MLQYLVIKMPLFRGIVLMSLFFSLAEAHLLAQCVFLERGISQKSPLDRYTSGWISKLYLLLPCQSNNVNIIKVIKSHSFILHLSWQVHSCRGTQYEAARKAIWKLIIYLNLKIYQRVTDAIKIWQLSEILDASVLPRGRLSVAEQNQP